MLCKHRLQAERQREILTEAGLQGQEALLRQQRLEDLLREAHSQLLIAGQHLQRRHKRRSIEVDSRKAELARLKARNALLEDEVQEREKDLEELGNLAVRRRAAAQQLAEQEMRDQIARLEKAIESVAEKMSRNTEESAKQRAALEREIHEAVVMRRSMTGVLERQIREASGKRQELEQEIWNEMAHREAIASPLRSSIQSLHSELWARSRSLQGASSEVERLREQASTAWSPAASSDESERSWRAPRIGDLQDCARHMSTAASTTSAASEIWSPSIAPSAISTADTDRRHRRRMIHTKVAEFREDVDKEIKQHMRKEIIHRQEMYAEAKAKAEADEARRAAAAAEAAAAAAAIEAASARSRAAEAEGSGKRGPFAQGGAGRRTTQVKEDEGFLSSWTTAMGEMIGDALLKVDEWTGAGEAETTSATASPR